MLSKMKKTVNKDFFLKFSLHGISASLCSLSSTAFGIFDAYSSTKRQAKTQLNRFLKRREVAVCSTYLMATGTQRQHFSVLHGIGFSMGYSSIIGQGTQFKLPTPESTTADMLNDIDGVEPGRHARKNKKKNLSQACRATARALASTGLFLVMYDNINMMVHVAEQILGRKNTQENGTCATEVALHDAKLEDLLTADLNKGIANAPALTVENLEFTEEEAKFFRQNMVHTILRIIIPYGGEDFSQFKEDLDNSQPVSADKIAGNIEVMEAINKELGLDVNDPNYVKYIKILAGGSSWKHIVPMPGLFHAKIADCHGVLQTHFSKPSAGFRSAGSLSFHNTVLDRLPITLTSLPPFRKCCDLIMVSLYARILHCLLLVSKKKSLEEYTEDCSWENLVGHAEKIYDEFANADTIQELWELRVPEEWRRDAELAAKAKLQKKLMTPQQKEQPPHVRKGDMVFENAILFPPVCFLRLKKTKKRVLRRQKLAPKISFELVVIGRFESADSKSDWDGGFVEETVQKKPQDSDPLERLARLQSFDGHFSSEVFALLKITETDLHAIRFLFPPGVADVDVLAATVLAMVFLQSGKLSAEAERDAWEGMYEKAKEYVEDALAGLGGKKWVDWLEAEVTKILV
ncbi:hypothetical protein DFH08DRAFT_956742 [Mycena albidolilacea]|uniref:DUF6589 domain-containing protein n=1 Tax=Mycena albidolilacea TaxID=1033008 RepID=A0AAD7AAX6_9AGAR|nr:hypothetical protein DFH08DRAFT_956742 [Mycena albidolilacea]